MSKFLVNRDEGLLKQLFEEQGDSSVAKVLA